MNTDIIERELHVDASPEVVFAVVSEPANVQQWWPDEAVFEPLPGAPGRIRFGDPAAGGQWVEFTVAESDPPRRFAFRWTHGPGETAKPGNSLLVVFELEPEGRGTRLRMTETGFAEVFPDPDERAAQIADHVSGWDHFLPQLPPLAVSLA
jgi:uncharacterized protein YndB with AHSA1/START domain